MSNKSNEKLKNAPSTTPEKSGKKRGNNEPKGNNKPKGK